MQEFLPPSRALRWTPKLVLKLEVWIWQLDCREVAVHDLIEDGIEVVRRVEGLLQVISINLCRVQRMQCHVFAYPSSHKIGLGHPSRREKLQYKGWWLGGYLEEPSYQGKDNMQSLHLIYGM